MQNKQIIDKTMSISAANWWGSGLALGATCILFLLFKAVWQDTRLNFSLQTALIGAILLVISIVVHELIHGIGYWLGGANWSEIKFGFKKATPYAHCTIPLKLAGYRWAVALPGLILGVGPTLIAFWTGSYPLFVYATVMLISAAGDLLILWLLRDAPHTALVFDHPSAVGCELHIGKAI